MTAGVSINWISTKSVIGVYSNPGGYDWDRVVEAVDILQIRLTDIAPRSRDTYPDTCPDFLTILFQFPSSIYFWVVIAYVIWSQIWILSLRVSIDLDLKPDTGLLPYLTFLVVWFDQFQFQTLFFNILDFSWFSKNFQNFSAKSLKLVSVGIADWFSDFFLVFKRDWIFKNSFHINS